MKENQEEMRKLKQSMLITGGFILAVNIYYYCFDFLSKFFVNEYVNYIYYRLQIGFSLFSSAYITLAIAQIFIGVFCIADRGVKKSDNTYKILGKFNFTISKEKGILFLVLGIIIYFLSPFVLILKTLAAIRFICYLTLILVGLFAEIAGAYMIHRTLKDTDDDDYFNEIQQSTFPQCEEKVENEYSVNIPTIYRFGKKTKKGWINFVNPFRATAVMGTPGSGKSFAFINEFIRQHTRKGFALYVYDYKFPTLTTLTYNEYLKNKHNSNIYPVTPKFRMINFDDPRYSHRCNPMSAYSLERVDDAYECAYTIMMNLNRSWLQKQGDFFVESPINFLTAVIWYFRNVECGRYCTLAHIIEWCGRNSADIIAIMSTYPELMGYMRPFYEALEKGVYEQLQGQVASVQIPLSRLRSHELYWVIGASDFDLSINDKKSPIILCTGNNPERQTTYGAALSLINGRLTKKVNKQGRLPLSFIVDELPTIFFKGIDTLIATARSNKVSICLGYQDNTQLIRDYGEKEAKVIIGTPGNIISGQVKGNTARDLQEMFGKNKQHSKSVNTSSENTSVNISEKEDYMIPASKIAQLSQGSFVGLVADDIKYPIPQKVFHARVNLDVKKLDAEEKEFKPIPKIYDFSSIATLEKLDKFSNENLGTSDKKLKNILQKFIDNKYYKKSLSQKDISMTVTSFKNEINSVANSSYYINKIDDIEKSVMLDFMEKNTRKIETELDNLIKKEIEKIYTCEQYKEIREMRDKILKT